MAEFAEFLTEDGRHDLWLHSPRTDATLVWDRHDLIYAYGPLEQFRAVPKESLLREGQVDGPQIRTPTCTTLNMTRSNGESFAIFNGPAAPC
jgi:hypothetical protein